MVEGVSPERTELLELLEEVAATVAGIDPAAPDAAARLEAAHPFRSPGMRRVRALAKVGVEQGWLLPREAGTEVRFGRLAKDLRGHAVDCVLMSGRALGHTHPRGEVNIGFAWEGEAPRFDGQPEGWIVFPPGSHHVPTVTGGRMLFVYFLPGGEVVWDPPPPPSAGSPSA